MSIAAPERFARLPFVGRAHELRLLQAGLEHVVSGNGAAFLIAGEPGIGKTRLADELAILATRQGARVFWGRCWQGGGAPGFWPWVQILRAVKASDLWPRMVAEPHTFLAEIVQLVAEGGGISESTQNPPADAEQARFRLFDSVARTAKWLAALTPLAFILDDLHDADMPSLLLLRFLAREIRDSRILLVGTYRDIEARRSPMLSPIFGHLARESQHLQLSGLSAAQVEQFIDESFDLQLPSSLKAEVFRATEGNPFFVDEVARLLVARVPVSDLQPNPPRLQIPDTVRAAIRERLAPLSAASRSVLTIAAALGNEFDLMMIEKLVPAHTNVLDAIEEAVGLGIVYSSPTTGKHTFSHTLIRNTIHDDLPIADRARLHRSIAEELERRAGAGADVRISVLAHHFLMALPAADGAAAAMYSIRAGDAALQQLAYEDAVRHYSAARHVMEQRETDPEAIADLLLKLGDAQRWADDLPTGRATFQRVAAIARQLLQRGGGSHAVSLLARAALGYARVSETGQVDHGLIALLEEALAAVGNNDSALHSRLLARLAVGLYFSGDRQRREAYSREAIAIAERIGDRGALVNALVAEHFTIWGPDSLSQRLRVAAQVVRLCQELGEHETELEARAWCITDLIEAGRIEEAWSEHQAFVRLAEHHRFPLYNWYALMQQSMYACVHGNSAEAESLAQQAAAIGARAELPNTNVFLLSQMLSIRTQQGRGGELEAETRELAERMPSMVLWRAVHILTLLQGGRFNEGRTAFRQLAEDDFACVPRDGMWLSAMMLLANSCVRLSDTKAAKVIYEQLLPYADRVAVSASAISCAGTPALSLGCLALLLDRPSDAEQHLKQALSMFTRMRSRIRMAMTKYHLAHCVAASRPDYAAQLAQEAVALAKEAELSDDEWLVLVSEMPSPASRSASALTAGDSAAATATPTDSQPTSSSGRSKGSFRREGEFWTIALEDTVLRLKDSKGLRYLHHLLAHPDHEFHALELTSLVDGTPVIEKPRPRPSEDLGVVTDLGDCGEVLDTRAMAAYKQRLRDLQEDLAEANEFNDLGRKDSLQSEIDFLTQQLSAATGLGGRQRRSGGHAEQARVNVTKAISSAIKKIRSAQPTLGRMLGNSVKTGTFCSYAPDAISAIHWEL